MDPLVNAVLGILFLVTGVVALGLMFRLRGSARSPAKKSSSRTAAPAVDRSKSPAKVESAAPPETKQHRDEFEPHMAMIHAMATSGSSIIEPMGTRVPLPASWSDLLIKGAQLARLPLNEDEPVNLQTTIGPAARQPLVVEMPILITHMSFGALSRDIKIALAKGSAAVGTATSSGEGGILEDELQAAHRYIFEYVPHKYSVTDENLQRVDAIEIKIGQSAKPGMGGLVPARKVTPEIAKIRGCSEGEDIGSPAHFDDIRTPEDLQRTVDELRQRSDGRPIGIKIAAGNIEADLEFALTAKPDFITIDGRPGATGAAPKVVKDATSVPTVFALYRARKYLNEHAAQHVSLIITGGLRISSDFAKALCLGADAVAIGTAALMAAGCQQYRICNTGRCPVGITTHDPALTRRLDIDQAAARVANFLRVSAAELMTFARLAGHDDIHDLAIADLCTTSAEISDHTDVEHV